MGFDEVMGQDEIDVDLTLVKETEKAYLLTDGDTQAWAPKRLVTCYMTSIETGETYSFTMPEWLAEDKGWT